MAGAEVEAGQVAHEREAGQPEAHVDAPLIAPGNRALAEQRQSIPDRQFASAGLIDQTVELIAQHGQLQPVQHGDQMIVVTHQKPPPIAASDSANGRSNVVGVCAAATSATAAMRTGRPFVPAMPARWLSSVTRPWRPFNSA
jgi:hypothetical protein